MKNDHKTQTYPPSFLQALAVAIAATLSACGGGGSSDSPSAAPSQTCSRTVQIQMFGDSTQEQQGNYLQLALDLALGPGVAVVENLGLSGSTAADFPASRVRAGAIVVVNYGINDVRESGTSVEAYKARLRAINASVYQTPSPPFDGYAQAMREVAAELGRPVIDVSAKVRAMPGWELRVWDGVHPDPGLYWIISQQIVAPSLADLVRKSVCAG